MAKDNYADPKNEVVVGPKKKASPSNFAPLIAVYKVTDANGVQVDLEAAGLNFDLVHIGRDPLEAMTLMEKDKTLKFRKIPVNKVAKFG